MPRPSLDRALAELIDKLEPALAQAFLDAIASMRDGVDMRALTNALERNDIEGAIAALDITPADFNRYVLERMSAYATAGELNASYISTKDAQSVRFTFDMSNPRAERTIREMAASSVTHITDETEQTLRETIFDGYSKGSGPKQIALDIAGRVNPVSGRREGGIVGLSGPQAGYVRSMRERLASGDPDEMVKVLGRFDKDGKWIKGTGMTLRDKRLDARVKKAIMEGRPVAQKDIDQMASFYADALLKRRAEDIARTETAQGVMAARKETYRQAIEKEGMPPDAIIKRWRHLGGLRDARDQHVAMAGKEVTGLDTPFVMPDGAEMQHSHDPAGGVKHNANCRCSTDFDIDFTWGS